MTKVVKMCLIGLWEQDEDALEYVPEALQKTIKAKLKK